MVRTLSSVVLAGVLVLATGCTTTKLTGGAPTPEQLARCSNLGAQSVAFCRDIYHVPPMPLPDKAEEASQIELRMGIFKPPGPGPFPAVVLLNACKELASATNLHSWGAEALKAGYVVFVVDSWGPRGLPDGMCMYPPPVNGNYLRVRDAYDALHHLAAQPYVDAARIGAIGFSQGGRGVYMLASPFLAQAFSATGRRFAGLVSMYGECFNRKGRFDNINPRSDRPLLALLGEIDEDGDPRECLPRLEAARMRGAPFEWHVYPNTGHEWDKQAPSRFVPYYGAPSGQVWFAYDSAVTADSQRRAFAFLEKVMPKQ